MSRGSRSNVGGVGRWIMVGSEIPIMVIAGAYIGYYIGKQIPWISPFSIVLGAFLGFGVGVYNTYKVIQVLERRSNYGARTAPGKRLFKGRKQEEHVKPGRNSSKDILELLKLQREEEREKVVDDHE